MIKYCFDILVLSLSMNKCKYKLPELTHCYECYVFLNHTNISELQFVSNINFSRHYTVFKV